MKSAFPVDWPGAATIGREELREVADVVRSRSLFRYYGPRHRGKVCAFEQAFARAIGTRHALGVSSGTASLRVALAALGIGPGDEVILPAVTFIASVGAVVAAGAKPVFAEVDESLTLDPADARRKVSRRTRALMPVHLQGTACDMNELRRIGLPILEDSAQSCGARYRGKRVGSIGEIGAFSLQYNKILTCGEGGAVTTRDRKLFERAVRYHDQGVIRPPSGKVLGLYQPRAFMGENFRMSELAGAVALAQVRKLETILRGLRRRFDAIKSGLTALGGFSFRTAPDPAGEIGIAVVFYASSRLTAVRMVDGLRRRGVPALRLYDGDCVYRYPQIQNGRTAWGRSYGRYPQGLCPRSEDLIGRAIWLPTSLLYTDRHTRAVIRSVDEVRREVV